MADNEGTNRWLFVKSELVERISHNPTIQNSTNCMMALAVELGRIRSGLMTLDDWYNLRGIGYENREVRPDGVVLVRVSDFADYEQQRRDAMVRRLQAIQSLRERIARNIVWGFEGFLESTTFLALPTDVRAEFVSNIVSVARFTHQEVCDLNLTNGVVNCQKEDE